MMETRGWEQSRNPFLSRAGFDNFYYNTQIMKFLSRNPFLSRAGFDPGPLNLEMKNILKSQSLFK